MKVVNEITGYLTSRSYDTLWDLAKNQSIICICRWRDTHLRDICQTVWNGTLMEISARGTAYVWADTLEYFTEQCKRYDVEWVLPETQYIMPPRTDKE